MQRRELQIEKDFAQETWRGFLRGGLHSTTYEIPVNLLESLHDQKYIDFINLVWEKNGWALRLRLEHLNE